MCPVKDWGGVHVPSGGTGEEYMCPVEGLGRSTCAQWRDWGGVHVPSGGTGEEYMCPVEGLGRSTCAQWRDWGGVHGPSGGRLVTTKQEGSIGEEEARGQWSVGCGGVVTSGPKVAQVLYVSSPAPTLCGLVFP